MKQSKTTPKVRKTVDHHVSLNWSTVRENLDDNKVKSSNHYFKRYNV